MIGSKNLGAMDPKSVLNKSVPSIAPLVSYFPRLSSSDNLNEMDRAAPTAKYRTQCPTGYRQLRVLVSK